MKRPALSKQKQMHWLSYDCDRKYPTPHTICTHGACTDIMHRLVGLHTQFKKLKQFIINCSVHCVLGQKKNQGSHFQFQGSVYAVRRS